MAVCVLGRGGYFCFMLKWMVIYIFKPRKKIEWQHIQIDAGPPTPLLINKLKDTIIKGFYRKYTD